MQRRIFFAYGVFSHLLFLATYAYMAGFVGDLFVPKSIDSAPTIGLYPFVVDLLLLALFAMQHSIMARPGFKRIWTRLIPEPIERSTYVMISNLVIIFLMWQWQGLGGIVWEVQYPAAHSLLWGLFAVGWLLVPGVSLMINHFDLFGTRQVWLYLQGKPYTALPFRTPMLYSRIRHPLYVGWALAFWAIPTMTLGHLLFAAALTIYMAVAVLFEERDLLNYFGEDYRAYQRRVPMFVPGLGAMGESPPKGSM